MKLKLFTLLCYLFALVLLVSSTAKAETSKDENMEEAQEEYHVNDGYGGGSWGGYGGGGYGGPGGGGGWGGYGGYGGGGWGRRGGGYGGGGWGGPGGGGGGGWGAHGGRRWGCRFGCCGHWYHYGGCSQCCRSLTQAIAFNENAKATP